MSFGEHHFGVWLSGRFVGVLRQRGDHVRFVLHPSYTEDPHRPVLGQVFEQDLDRVHASALRLPPWFSNLLPEGVQRGWVARQRGVSEQREMELLAEVGHDLPGAVTVLPIPPDVIDAPDGGAPPLPAIEPPGDDVDARARFSLAGVQLKLSMVAAGDRLVLPLGGALGDWIVKFPASTLPHLPVIEHATMELARRSGIDVPPIRLATREGLPNTPGSLWVSGEERAFAIERFDRGPDRSLVHIEDFAQVRDVYPSPGDLKYRGSYEGLAALVRRGRDDDSLRELVRRITFNVLVDNSDAHLKNWSLIYLDPRRPSLSPAYDLVSIAPYPAYGGEIALSIDGNRRADHVRLRHLGRLADRVGMSREEGAGVAEEVIMAVEEAWPAVADQLLADHAHERDAITTMIRTRAASLRSA